MIPCKRCSMPMWYGFNHITNRYSRVNPVCLICAEAEYAVGMSHLKRYMETHPNPNLVTAIHLLFRGWDTDTKESIFEQWKDKEK